MASADHARLAALAAMRNMPQVTSRNCGPGQPTVINRQRGATQIITICSDRIARLSEDARRQAVAAIDSGEVRRQAINGARMGIQSARASIAANRDIPEEDRAEALRDLDREAAELEREIAQES
jgi:hypothetical protein